MAVIRITLSQGSPKLVGWTSHLGAEVRSASGWSRGQRFPPVLECGEAAETMPRTRSRGVERKRSGSKALRGCRRTEDLLDPPAAQPAVLKGRIHAAGLLRVTIFRGF